MSPTSPPKTSPTAIPHLLHTAATHHPDTVAIDVAGDRTTTYAELYAAASRVAAMVQESTSESDHIAVLMPNSVAWAEAMYGTALAGRTGVLLNPRLTVAELTYQVAQSESRIVFVDGLDPELLAGLRDRLPDVTFTTTDAARSGEGAGRGEAASPHAPRAVDPQATAVIIYTSGTTSAPKGVELSHAALLHNASKVADRFALTDDDRVFGAGPFFHSGGLTMHILMCALRGITAHSIVRFRPDEVLSLIEEHSITIYSGIETLFLRLLQAENFDPSRMRSVRTGWTTGTPAIADIIALKVGVPGVITVYGISEAGPNVFMSSVDDSPDHRLRTVGRPLDGVEVRIIDPLTDKDMPDGARGELVVRTPSLMKGYYAKQAETADALRSGWLHTGDILIRRPDGFYEFGGRRKDTVRTFGENVSCAEVEDSIYEHTDVSLAAVVALPDPERGEIVAAAIVPGGARTVTTHAALTAALTPHLSGYKLPRRVVVLDEMPMTASGKVRKAGLKDILLKEGTPL